VDFPYIPTFLAFREMPLLLKLYEKAKVKPDIFFIDGQGIAHPRRCGIASHFGVETGEISVGVAKTKLFGYYREPAEERGSFTYLKQGHRISLKTAIDLVLRTSRYRVPEPTRLAHNLLQRIRRESLF